MSDLKKFITQNKLLSAGVVVVAVLIGVGIGRIGQGDAPAAAVPKQADSLETRLAGVGPAPELKFDEVPGIGEQIGLNCSITYEERAQRFRLWEGTATVRINIDTGKRKWWATNTQAQKFHPNKGVWVAFDGRSAAMPANSEADFYVLRDDKRVAEDNALESVSRLQVNRLNGEFWGTMHYDDGTVGVYGGHCDRGSFEPQPEKKF